MTALHYATLVSPHFSVANVSLPFGSDTSPPSGPGPGARDGIYLFFCLRRILKRRSLIDAYPNRTAGHAAGPLWTPARFPSSICGGARFSDSRVGGRVGKNPPLPG